MKVQFYASNKRDAVLADLLKAGIEKSGDKFEAIASPVTMFKNEDTDVVNIMFGVKSRAVWYESKERGYDTVLFDKGYTRSRDYSGRGLWRYLRASVNSMHPTRYLMNNHYGWERASSMGLLINPNPRPSELLNTIVIAGSSAKCHKFVNIDSPTRYYTTIINKVDQYRNHMDPIIYRPKPSWKDAEPIDGSIWSTRFESMREVLDYCKVLITHSSNACVEAALNMTPIIVLGDAVAKPIAMSEINRYTLQSPNVVSKEKIQQWINNLAHCQFTLEEIQSGFAWYFLKTQIMKDRHERKVTGTLSDVLPGSGVHTDLPPNEEERV